MKIDDKKIQDAHKAAIRGRMSVLGLRNATDELGTAQFTLALFQQHLEAFGLEDGAQLSDEIKQECSDRLRRLNEAMPLLRKAIEVLSSEE